MRTMTIKTEEKLKLKREIATQPHLCDYLPPTQKMLYLHTVEGIK